MFDDNNDYFNSLFGSTTTETQKTDEKTDYNPQSDYSATSTDTYSSPYEKDDYSTTQNYTEQQSYDSSSSTYSGSNETEQKQTFKMNTPLIEKSTPTVNLVKSQSKIHLETRMKIVLTVFSVIVACLMFMSVYNFIVANRLEASFADKQTEISMLEKSIFESKQKYNEKVEEYITSGHFNPVSEQNTDYVKLYETYEETDIEDLPSNWFNDVCEFLSNLFS